MSLILVWTLFRGVLWLSVLHSLICHRVWTNISNCVQMSGLKHWPESNKNKKKKIKTNKCQQRWMRNFSPERLSIAHITELYYFRMARKILHRMSFSFHQFHNWSKFPWIYLAMSCLSYLSSHQCNRFSLSSLVANIWVLQRFLEIIPSFGFSAYIEGFLSSQSGLDKKFHFDITSAVVTPHIHRQINP